MKAIHDIKHCQGGQNLLIYLTNRMKIKIHFRPSLASYCHKLFCIYFKCLDYLSIFCKPLNPKVGFLLLSVQGKYPSSSQEVVTTSMTFLDFLGSRHERWFIQVKNKVTKQQKSVSLIFSLASWPNHWKGSFISQASRTFNFKVWVNIFHLELGM